VNAAGEILQRLPPKTKITKTIRMAPMLKMPDLEKEYLDELNKKQLIF